MLLLSAPYAAALRLAVTGAAGYLGREIAALAVEEGHSVRAVVKSGQVVHGLPAACELLVVEDLTDPAAAREAADGTDAVIHTASVFRKVDDMDSDLVAPNIELAEQMVCACAASTSRLVLTSSMAAVRGAGQRPRQGLAYTTDDWNRVSRRDGPGFEPYQFSKAQAERRAWELTGLLGGEMVALCPPLIFGPPRGHCDATSVAMVVKWLEDGLVPSRLAVDVRDCALAHLRAATLPAAAGKRYIVSCEARLPAAELVGAMRARLLGLGRAEVASRLSADEEADSNFIAVGEREVIAAPGLSELGVVCRPPTVTLSDMAAALTGGDPGGVGS